MAQWLLQQSRSGNGSHGFRLGKNQQEIVFWNTSVSSTHSHDSIFSMLQTGIQGLITNQHTTTNVDSSQSTHNLPAFQHDLVTKGKSSSEAQGKDANSMSKLKVATQLKYAMTKTRTIEHNKIRNHSDNNVENLDSNVPYIALFDPLDPEYTESLNRTDCTGNDISNTYSRMKSNSKSFGTIMPLGAAALQKVELYSISRRSKCLYFRLQSVL